MILDPNNTWRCGKIQYSLYAHNNEISGDPGLGEISGGRLAKPHAFPWIVKMCESTKNGSLFCGCVGTLITHKHVLTAWACVNEEDGHYCTARDLSKGDHKVILGRNHIPDPDDDSLYTIPIIGVKVPVYAGLNCKRQKQINRRTEIFNRHDFAMLILKEKVKFSDQVQPICLPNPGESHNGQRAIAAGWGMFATNNKQDDWTGQQSKFLKRVNLSVSKTKYSNDKMLGTKVEFDNGEWQDPCAGDGGGPLMYQDPDSDRWVIIGTLKGSGFDCRTGKMHSQEGKKEGYWNKVSAHTNWILETLGID